MDRTIRLALNTTPEQAAALAETAVQFTRAFNAVCAAGWGADEKNGVKLHHLTYYSIKAHCPELVSDLIVQARTKATEAIKSVFALRKKGRKVSCPRASRCPPRYNHHTATVKWDRREVRLSTAGGRMTIPFLLPEHYAKYAGGRTLTADLMHKKGRWFLHVAVELPDVQPILCDVVVGVDLGLNRPAVTSSAKFLGKRQWREVERRYFRLRRSLQAKGTKSAKRHLKRLSGKVNRFRRDCDHVLSRRIVDSVAPGTTIVVENLVNIRKGTKQRGRESRRRMHSWSFDQLRSFLEYKAHEKGCRVVGVDPRHTSQRCFKCGHTARNNRRSQARFVCRECGYEVNADLNGARNIGWKYQASSGMSAAGEPQSTGSSSGDPAPASRPASAGGC